MKRLYYLVPAGLLGIIVVVMGVAQIFAPDMAATLKEEIEMQGSAMTGVPVTVERVELSPVTGEGRLIGLVIGNPPGYRTHSALRLGEVEVRIDPRVLGISPLIIRAIDIRHLTVTLEGGLSNNNLTMLERNVGAYLKEAAARARAETMAQPGLAGATNQHVDSEHADSDQQPGAERNDDDLDTDSGSGSSPRLIIKDLNITNGQVVLAPRMLMGATMTNSLKDIHLRDVGANKGGASVGELVGALVNAIMVGVGETADQPGSDDHG